MTVAVVIPVFNRYELTVRCLDAVRATAPDAFLWVVDDGSTDETQNLGQSVPMLHNTRNMGFAVSCNRGAKVAFDDPTVGHVVFLNNDTVPQVGWLDVLLGEADGVAGARLTYPDGRLQHAGVELVSVGGFLEARNVQHERPTGPVSAVTGACLAVSRGCWDALGGFDEGFDNGYEDVDLCLRARRAGWPVRYCAESHVVHLESASGAERWRSVSENVQRLQDKWGAA